VGGVSNFMVMNLGAKKGDNLGRLLKPVLDLGKVLTHVGNKGEEERNQAIWSFCPGEVGGKRL